MRFSERREHSDGRVYAGEKARVEGDHMGLRAEDTLQAGRRNSSAHRTPVKKNPIALNEHSQLIHFHPLNGRDDSLERRLEAHIPYRSV